MSAWRAPLALALAAPLVLALAAAAPGADAAARGQRLFLGTEPVVARLAGQAEPLPASAVHCVHCHSLAPGAASAAPPLAPATLLRPQARRGAPAARYTGAQFCRAVTRGIDPQFVLLARAMPRFELDGAQCAALWAYLTAGAGDAR